MTTTVTGLLLAGLAPAGMAASLAAREPDQGVPARSLCRSHLDRHHAGKSAAPVVRLDGLCAAVRLAPHRAASHTVRQSDLRHHSSKAAQDRCPRTSECPPHQGRDGVSMSGGPCLGLRCHSSRRRQRSRLARLTRAAATRNPRGITPRPTETPSRLSHRSNNSRVCRRHGGPRLQKNQQASSPICPIMQS